MLEGLYVDGVSDEDVDRILLRTHGNHYDHFVYACPVCTPAIHALEAYRSRPQRFYSLKTERSTFGPGLPDEIRELLWSERPADRVEAIGMLIHRWTRRRTGMPGLQEVEASLLAEAVDRARADGARLLDGYLASGSAEHLAPAFSGDMQCGACSGAAAGTGMLSRSP